MVHDNSGSNHNFLDTTRCAKECPLLCIYSVPADSLVDCGDPGTPTNGQRSLSSTTYNSAVIYTCDVGYTLQGSTSRTCQSNGQWSGSVPQCKGMSELIEGLAIHPHQLYMWYMQYNRLPIPWKPSQNRSVRPDQDAFSLGNGVCNIIHILCTHMLAPATDRTHSKLIMI